MAETRPAWIGRFLRDRGVADGAVVYIASDERKPDFREPLKETWRVLRYVDFPALEALISSADETSDSYLLYQVEMTVLREADLRIGTMPNEVWTWMHDWLMDKEIWPPPSVRQRLLQAVIRRLDTPIRRIEDRLPRIPKRMLVSARHAAHRPLRGRGRW